MSEKFQSNNINLYVLSAFNKSIIRSNWYKIINKNNIIYILINCMFFEIHCIHNKQILHFSIGENYIVCVE